MNRTEVLYHDENFRFSKIRRRKTGKIYYEIRLMTWMAQDFDEQVRDMIDPTRSKGGRLGYHWKYRTREEAEKMLSMLLLRWS